MSKKYTVFIILITFLLLLFGVYFSDGPEAIKELAQKVNIHYIRAVFGMMVGYWLMQIMIAKEIANNLGEKFPFFVAMKGFMIGEFFSAITPLATGGQPMQVVYLSKKGIKSGSSSCILAIQLFFYHISRILLGLILTIVYWRFFYSGGHFFIFFLILGFILNFAIAFFMIAAVFKPEKVMTFVNFVLNLLYKIKVVKDKEKLLTQVNTEVELFNKSIQEFRGQELKVYLILILQNMISFVFYYGIGYYVFKSLDVSTPTFTMCLAAQIAIALVSAYIPMPGGSLGAEGIFFLIFSQLVPEGSPIFMAILMWRMVTYYFTILATFPFTLKLK